MNHPFQNGGKPRRRHPEAPEQDTAEAMTCAGEAADPLEDFNRAVNAIAGAARKFKDVAGGGDAETSYIPGNDENPYSSKLPVSAFCLRLAHQVWRETRPNAQPESDGPPPGFPFGMIGSMAGAGFGGPPPGMRPATLDELVEMLGSMAEGLPPEQKAKLAASLADQPALPGPEAKEPCPDCGHAPGERPAPDGPQKASTGPCDV